MSSSLVIRPVKRQVPLSVNAREGGGRGEMEEDRTDVRARPTIDICLLKMSSSLPINYPSSSSYAHNTREKLKTMFKINTVMLYFSA